MEDASPGEELPVLCSQPGWLPHEAASKAAAAVPGSRRPLLPTLIKASLLTLKRFCHTCFPSVKTLKPSWKL